MKTIKKNIYTKNPKYTRRKIKYRIKKKGGYTRLMKQNIDKITEQNKLACVLRDDFTLKNLCIDILWNLLNLVKKIHPEKFTDKIKQSITITKNEENIVTKIGFDAEEVDKIINTLKENSLGKFIRLSFLYNKPHAVTACLTLLNNENYQAEYIMNDKELFDEFITKLKIIYSLPDTFSNETFIQMYEKTKLIENKTNETKTRSFNMLIIKIMQTDNDIKSVINKNYGREIFSRSEYSSDHIKTPKNINEYYNCFDDITGTEIYDVSASMNVRGIFIEDLFNLYDRILIGGISGSVYYLYFMVFYIFRNKYKKTDALLLKVLSIAIMDYVPLWHSLEEILLTYSILLNKENKEYDIYKLDQNPLEYYKNLFSSYSSTITTLL